MSKKNYIILAVAVIIGAAIQLFVPAVGGLTPAGVSMLAVFIPTIILWIGIGTGWTSFLALTVLALMRCSTVRRFSTPRGATALKSLSSPCSIIVQVMIDSGAMQHIAEWIISRRIVRGRPYVFYALLCLAISLSAPVVYPVIMCFIFLKLIDSVTESIGYTKQDKFYKAALLITLWVTTVMDGVWPFARPIPIVIMTFLSGLGYDISIVDWMKVSIPFGILCILAALLIIRFIYRPDVSKFKNFDDAAIRQRLKANPISRAASARPCRAARE